MKKTFTILFIFSILFQIQAQDLYNLNGVTVVDITFQESDWDALLQGFYDNDMGERLMAEVEINGEAFDSVGVRYRGGSSTYSEDFAKNPINIKLDYLKNQDYQGFEVLKLNNGAKDPSFVREVGSYELVRQYMKAPLANYAQVFINGNYHGLYVNVESVNRNFIGEAFQSDTDNTRFEASPSYNFESPTPPFGCAEANGSSLEYLGDGIICYFDSYDLQSDTGWEELAATAELLLNTPEDARTVLDLDRFIWMSALNSVLVNLDSYLGAETQNWFLYKQDNGLFVPVMEDFNESFGRYPWTTDPESGQAQTSEADLVALDPFLGTGNLQKPVLKVIFDNPTWRRMYVAHYRTILEENYANGALQNRLENFQNQISNEVSNDVNALYSFADFEDNLNAGVADFVNGETAYGVSSFVNNRYDYLQTLPEFTATQPTITNRNNDPISPLPNSQVTITAEVENANFVLLGHRGDLIEAFQRVEMLDDGNNGDGAAGDGVYGATVAIDAGGLQYYIYAENEQAGFFSPQKAELEFHSIGTSADVVINELLVDNETIQADQDGEFDDWAELYNNTDQTINLSGWFLSDNPNILDKWEFPNGTFIDGNGYLIVWVDDDEEQDGLHTSFNLSNSGEEIFLVNPQLEIVDQLIFGPQFDDISLARCPNGIGAFQFETPTFNEDNTAACVVSTEELVANVDFKIYPNPAKERIFIEKTEAKNRSVRLINLMGQTVFTGSFVDKMEILVADLPQGIYFLEMEGAKVEKVMVE